ncbi:MFS general substrate transporter [Pseudovirgaria hyperparasitica]|uniref:MFS general substrate transporter n=1 Tax=Pseudovirgaria hyperparasitica TaxID=470096 RepID=A0A6A6VUQ1_9PEZI|nr:MFS general substrate transporter [Pseudovirgaria hyperparasitica]KAF2754408.1 MFS general substrate transporter [Pseudovirgaria hyperparasitica]
MDRTALKYANLFGYQEALGLEGNQFSYLSAMLIRRFPAQRVIGVSCLLWGITVLILTRCRSFSSALAVRFLLGLCEAAVTPGLTLMAGFWWTRREIQLRQCLWYSSLGWGGIIGSYISMGVSKLPVDLKPERWQFIFFILGGVTCLWSFLIIFALPNAPSNARFFTERERIVANKKFDRSQVQLAFIDPKAALLFVSVFAAAIPDGVVQSFSTVIIRDLGFSTTRTTELKSVGDAVQIVALVIGGIIILNVRQSRLLVATVANILCTLVTAQSVGFTVSLTTLSSNIAGYTHRSLTSALSGATIGLLVGYSIKLSCHLLALLGYMYFTNRWRDRQYDSANKEASDEAGMLDKTKFQNEHFRYVL